jgi:RNA polymerase primary sigma factor
MRHLQITSAITNRESVAVELYFGDISKTVMLTMQEEVELSQKIRQGDQAALNRLVCANLRFVVSVAKKYQYQGLPLSDLINDGNLGLIKAAQRFDETRGFKFISFAVWWIRQSILAGITENARMIRLPMNKVHEITKINRAAIAIEQQTLRDATQEQISEHLDMGLEKVKDGLYIAGWTCSYDVSLEEDGYTMLEKIRGDHDDTDANLMVESQQQEMNNLLSKLSEREQKIIRMTYGLIGEREMSPIDISKEMGMSAERVRQIRNMALDKLRKQSAGKMPLC